MLTPSVPKGQGRSSLHIAPSIAPSFCDLPITSPFKTEVGRERFLASRRLDTLPSTVFGYTRQGLLGGSAQFSTWNHRFEPIAFEPETRSYKVKHRFNYEKPNGMPRYWEDNLWFSETGMEALANLGPPVLDQPDWPMDRRFR